MAIPQRGGELICSVMGCALSGVRRSGHRAQQPGGSVRSQEHHVEPALRVLGRLRGRPEQTPRCTNPCWLLGDTWHQCQPPAQRCPAAKLRCCLWTSGDCSSQTQTVGPLSPKTHLAKGASSNGRAGSRGQWRVQSLPSCHSRQCCCAPGSDGVYVQ